MYLQIGVGLLIVDVVTDRQANLHDEMIQLLGQDAIYRFPTSSLLYSVAYRPVRTDPGGDHIEIRPVPLAVGQALPAVPLALRDGPTIPVDLDATYDRARQPSMV